MKKLKKTIGSLWGEYSEFHPYLLDYIHGDGKKILWFEYMDDRPFYYVVRVDSRLDIGNDFIDEVLRDLSCAIMDEAQEFMTDKQMDDLFEKGYFDNDDYLSCSREWPIPPPEGEGGGFTWGELRDWKLSDVEISIKEAVDD